MSGEANRDAVRADQRMERPRDVTKSNPTILGFTDLRPAKLVGSLDAADAPGRVFAFPDATPLAKFVRATLRGADFLRNSNADAILLYNGTGVLGLVSVLLARLYDVPLVVRMNGDIRRQHRDRLAELSETSQYGRLGLFALYHLATRLTYSVAAGYVPVSENLREEVASSSAYPDRPVLPVYNPVDFPRFESAEPAVGSRPELADRRVLLTVTNLDYEGKGRGVVELVDSVADLLAANDDLAYVVAGDGTYLDAVESAVETLVPSDVAERVHLLGYVDDVPSLLAAADVFVYKSYIDGYPNAILEAKAAGLPVVANPRYGVGEQVTHGETGFLVSDDAGYERAVGRLLADESERERLGRNARREVRETNSYERVGDRLLDAVARIVGDH